MGDFTDYNIIYHFKTDGILVVSGIPEEISSYGKLLNNGEYRYIISKVEDEKWLRLKIASFYVNLLFADFPSESEMTIIEYILTESIGLTFIKIE